MTVMLSTSLSMPVTLEAADIEPINRLPVVAQCCVGHVNTEPVSAVLDTSTQRQEGGGGGKGEGGGDGHRKTVCTGR